MLLLLIIHVNCPKQYRPELARIDVNYIGSIYNDIMSEEPLLAGLGKLTGISIGSCRVEPPFLQVLMGRIGLADLLNACGIDYVIGDMSAIHFDNTNYFIIPERMGFGISNLEGVRFALFYPGKKELSISDHVEIAVARERSDILWLIDESFAASGPRRVKFFIENRSLADTSWSALAVEPDSALLVKIRAFRQKLSQLLNYKFSIGGESIKNYVIERMSSAESADVILFPERLFSKDDRRDSLSIVEFIQKVDCGMRFKNAAGLTGKQVDSIVSANGYSFSGKVRKNNNQVVYPDVNGRYLFDIVAPR